MVCETQQGQSRSGKNSPKGSEGVSHTSKSEINEKQSEINEKQSEVNKQSEIRKQSEIKKNKERVKNEVKKVRHKFSMAIDKLHEEAHDAMEKAFRKSNKIIGDLIEQYHNAPVGKEKDRIFDELNKASERETEHRKQLKQEWDEKVKDGTQKLNHKFHDAVKKAGGSVKANISKRDRELSDSSISADEQLQRLVKYTNTRIHTAWARAAHHVQKRIAELQLMKDKVNYASTQAQHERALKRYRKAKHLLPKFKEEMSERASDAVEEIETQSRKALLRIQKKANEEIKAEAANKLSERKHELMRDIHVAEAEVDTAQHDRKKEAQAALNDLKKETEEQLKKYKNFLEQESREARKAFVKKAKLAMETTRKVRRRASKAVEHGTIENRKKEERTEERKGGDDKKENHTTEDAGDNKQSLDVTNKSSNTTASGSSDSAISSPQATQKSETTHTETPSLEHTKDAGDDKRSPESSTSTTARNSDSTMASSSQATQKDKTSHAEHLEELPRNNVGLALEADATHILGGTGAPLAAATAATTSRDSLLSVPSRSGSGSSVSGDRKGTGGKQGDLGRSSTSVEEEKAGLEQSIANLKNWDDAINALTARLKEKKMSPAEIEIKVLEEKRNMYAQRVTLEKRVDKLKAELQQLKEKAR